jgi:hypothetical protein
MSVVLCRITHIISTALKIFPEEFWGTGIGGVFLVHMPTLMLTRICEFVVTVTAATYGGEFLEVLLINLKY